MAKYILFQVKGTLSFYNSSSFTEYKDAFCKSKPFFKKKSNSQKEELVRFTFGVRKKCSVKLFYHKKRSEETQGDDQKSEA